MKAIIFDWGGVLIEHPISKMFSYFAECLGVDKDSLLKIYKKFENDLHEDKISEDFWWEKVCSELNLSEALSLGEEAFAFAYNPNEEVFSLVEKIQKNYKTGFLSNAEVFAMNFFKKQNYSMFDVAVFSCAEGIAKPDKRIYYIALERLAVKPYEAIFIDDNIRNIKGAESVGLKGILFENHEQLKKDLVKYKINL